MSAPIELLARVMADSPERQARIIDRIARHDEARMLAGQVVELLREARALQDVESIRKAIAAGGLITTTACALVRVTAFDDVRLTAAEIGGTR